MKALLPEILPEFHLPTEIYIQQDIIRETGTILSKLCSRVLMVITSTDYSEYSGAAEEVARSLKASNVGCIIYDEIPGDPNTEEVDLAVAFAKKTNCDLVLGFGTDGSINAAKAIALLINNYIFCNDVFSSEITEKPLPLVTMPVKPLFGLEIAPLFYLREIQNNTLKCYYNKILYPNITIIDPSLTLNIDEENYILSVVSTLAIATESVISTANNDIVNTFSLKAIDIIFRNLTLAYNEGQNLTPRIYLSTASVMAGISFSVSYLSVALAIALALSSRCEIDTPTGMGIILPHIMEFNLTSSPGKYVQMSKVMGEDVKDVTVIEAAIKAVEAIRKLELDVNIPQRLSDYNISRAELSNIANISMTFDFIQNAPRPLNPSEIETILVAAF